MKGGTHFLRGWVIIASVAGLVHAQEIVPLGAGNWRCRSPELSVSGGDELLLSVLMPSSLKAEDLVIDRWQIANGVMLPWEKGRRFQDAMKTDPRDAQGVATLRLTFPRVKNKTLFLVQFRTAGEPHAEAGRAEVWVYPPLNWEPLAARFKAATPRLAVFGQAGELGDFFNAHGIVFSKMSEEPPENIESGALMIGVLPETVWVESKQRLGTGGGRIIVFVTGASGLPGVYTSSSGTGMITRVTLPVIEALKDDPLAQETLLQLLEQHFGRAPAALTGNKSL